MMMMTLIITHIKNSLVIVKTTCQGDISANNLWLLYMLLKYADDKDYVPKGSTPNWAETDIH